MKTATRLFLVVATAGLLAGCAHNWAERNEPITFVPELLKSIESAPTRPIKLTDSQREQLLNSLQGPVRRDFLRANLQPEVWASWWYQRDKVTFVRFNNTNNGYVFISYLPDGRLFGSGGGATGEPPWTK